jgi:hypothetical protein
MADHATQTVWSELRSKVPRHDDAMATSTAGTTLGGRDVLYAVDCRSHLHLLIPVDEGPNDDKPADLQGLRVRHRIVKGNRQYLDLVASPAHEALFTPLAGEVITAVTVEARKPWKAVNAIIRAWQSAWKPVATEMPKKVQVGLFGELLTLQNIIIPACGPGGVHYWSGPDYERHDFIVDKIHLEVKTTRKSRHEHEISRRDQLEAPDERHLLVVSVLLEQSIGGMESVATKMDEIIDMIRSDGAASDTFMAKMVQLGWCDELRRSGQLLQFNIRGSHIYEVDDDFPRLPPEFAVPDGVVGIRYTVDLTNIPSLGVDDAMDMIRNGRE